MLSAKYTNSKGDSITFGTNGVYINESDLRDYQWDYTASHNRINYFSSSIYEKTLPITFTGDNRNTLADNFFELVDYDIRTENRGKLQIGDYYLSGFFYGSKKSNYSNEKIIRSDMAFVSDFLWRKEETYNFAKSREEQTAFLDYPYDYPYDYMMPTQEIYNSSYVDTDFRLQIYGPVSEPVVTINEHEYEVLVDVGEDESLVVDSVEKKIYLIDEDFKEINKFYARSRESYVFEHIPKGDVEIEWDGTFAFDLTLIEERSEPKWNLSTQT